MRVGATVNPLAPRLDERAVIARVFGTRRECAMCGGSIRPGALALFVITHVNGRDLVHAASHASVCPPVDGRAA